MSMKPIRKGDYFLLPVSPGCTAQRDRLVRMLGQHEVPALAEYWHAMRVVAKVFVLVNVTRCKRMAPSWARNIIKGRKVCKWEHEFRNKPKRECTKFYPCERGIIKGRKAND